MNTANLNVALVGCGKIGSRHADYIAKYAHLVCVCDLDISKAMQISHKYSCDHYSDYYEMLKTCPNIDLVSICTPNGIHADQAISGLRSGVNVLVEKPMALRVIDCERMIDEAERANKRLFVVKQNRFNKPVRMVKNLLDDGALGKIYSVQVNCIWNRNSEYYRKSLWHGTKELDGGILYTQFSHFVDLIYWFFGNIEAVRGYKCNYAHSDTVEFEDTGVASFRLRSGAIGSIFYTINAHKSNYEGSILIIGERGTVKIGGQYLNKLEYSSIDGVEVENVEDHSLPNDYGSYQGSMSNHDKVYENVIDVLVRNKSIQTNLMDGLKTVQIIEEIYRGAE